MKFKIKHRIQRFFGFTLLFIGISSFAIGIGMHFDKSDKKASEVGKPFAIASSSFIIIGGLLAFFGIKEKKREERIESIASIVKSYRRITVSALAEKLNIPIPEASRLLTEAITDNLITGNFDRRTDEFFTDEALDERVEIKFCPSCGSSLDKIYYQGESIKCNTCGVIF